MNSKDNEKLAAICGYITGDGHIQIKEGRHLVSFYNNDKNLIDLVSKYFFEVFGVTGKLYLKKTKVVQYRFFIISKEVTLYLKNLGVPVGRKTDILFGVPDFVFTGNQAIKSHYLQALFDSEGCVYLVKSRWRIEIEMYKREDLRKNGLFFMNQIKELLLSFNIKSSPPRLGRRNLRKDGTYSIAIKLDIESKEFEKFYKYIGFVDRIKEAKLLKAIAETHRPSRSRRYSEKELQSQAA